MSLIRKKSFTDEQFVDAVTTSRSIAEVLRKLGLDVGGANYKGVHRYVDKLKLDTSHWTGQGYLREQTHNWTRSKPLDEILTENSSYASTNNLKQRLIKEGILQNRCYECGLMEWRGKPVALHLDHKNGINNDNRKENLQLLCPNCHSQTPTFAGKNIRKIQWPSDKELLEAVSRDKSCTPIAQVLGIKPGTVRDRIRKIRNGQVLELVDNTDSKSVGI